MSSDPTARNALDGEASPFLQHGATQPVDWMPWGREAFERARREDRPILLDVGAVWCHWCHVMDAETYDDPEIAALINENYVAIKVDRDERPDVDARYQRAVQLMTGQGGWPLTAFLTPDGDVFYGGTYFPARDSHGRPSMRRVLTELARLWREDRERALESMKSVRENLVRVAEAEAQPGEPEHAHLAHIIEDLAQSFDFRNGGFGRAPKFPNPAALELLLDHALENDVAWARRVVVETMHAMARGGIFDQLGGGFHRYATDARWLVPHFEKMAYDNGPLLSLYARAAEALSDPELRETAEGIISYYRDVAPALLDEGGFPASQDADFGFDNDGDYWTWTREEVHDALGGDPLLVRAAMVAYGLDDPGSSMHQDPERHVLFRAADAQTVARTLGIDVAEAKQTLAEVRSRLKQVRDARPRPFVDETLYSDWVSLVASGHIAAARWIGDDEAGAAALRALHRVLGAGWVDGAGLRHRVGDDGSGPLLDDQAYGLVACLDAFEYTQDAQWLTRARALADVLLDRFRDIRTGAFRDRPVDAQADVDMLDQPLLPIADSPTPAGNSTAALGLLRLHALMQNQRYADAAYGVLRAFAGAAHRIGGSASTWARALAWAIHPVTSVVIVDTGDTDGDTLFAAALRSTRPRTVVRRIRPGELEPDALPPDLRAMVTGEAPRAYVCAGRTCAAPVNDPAALTEVLHTLRG